VAFEFEHMRTSVPWRRYDKESKLIECPSVAALSVTVSQDISRLYHYPPGKRTGQPLMIDGSDGGSWVTEILDCRHRPFDHGTPKDQDGDVPNCQLVEVQVFGWPIYMCVAIRDIAAGEELTVVYGDHFWDGVTYVFVCGG
jgi:hypothetical protein